MIGFGTQEKNIINSFYFNSKSIPENLTDQSITVNAGKNRDTVNVDSAAYLNKATGPGRFAVGSQFDLVNVFFSPVSGGKSISTF